jgi:hypothetical protein
MVTGKKKKKEGKLHLGCECDRARYFGNVFDELGYEEEIETKRNYDDIRPAVYMDVNMEDTVTPMEYTENARLKNAWACEDELHIPNTKIFKSFIYRTELCLLYYVLY